jgi:hypothetical protein
MAKGNVQYARLMYVSNSICPKYSFPTERQRKKNTRQGGNVQYARIMYEYVV